MEQTHSNTNKMRFEEQGGKRQAGYSGKLCLGLAAETSKLLNSFVGKKELKFCVATDSPFFEFTSSDQMSAEKSLQSGPGCLPVTAELSAEISRPEEAMSQQKLPISGESQFTVNGQIGTHKASISFDEDGFKSIQIGEKFGCRGASFSIEANGSGSLRITSPADQKNNANHLK